VKGNGSTVCWQLGGFARQAFFSGKVCVLKTETEKGCLTAVVKKFESEFTTNDGERERI